MGVGVRGSGHLPEPEVIAVGLSGGVGVENAPDVGLGLDVENGRALVGAEYRRRAADGSDDACIWPGPTRGSPDAPRLWTKKPSKACASGCTPLKYVTSANADWDSPAAMSTVGRIPLRPAPVRRARATWV